MRKILRAAMLFAIIVLSASSLFAQSRTVTGTILDDKGVTLPGASVTVKGLSVSTGTNLDGKYSIAVPAGSTTLVFSFIGSTTQEIVIGTRTIVNVTLRSTATALNEVVVIGYGTAKRSDITSSISSISEKDIKNLPVAGVDQALQGKVAGVSVSTNGGAPGGGVSVRVRGITSVNGNEPLYVVDGVPLDATRSSIAQDQLGGMAGQSVQSAIATINPNDIASVDILKDASAQAIYGSRAANGVVLITTKRGKAGEGKISYDVYYGRQNVQKKIKLMDLSQFAQYSNEIQREIAGVNGSVYYPIGEYQNPAVLGKGTDWQDAIFQTGQIQNHQLAFSGGNDKTTYYTSLNYFDQSGTIIGSGLNRYTLRFNLDQQVKPWLKFGLSTNLSRTNQKITLTNGSDAVVSVAAANSPAAPVTTGDGNYASTISVGGYTFGNQTNPVALANLRDVRNIQSQAFANVYADLTITKHISFRNEASFSASLAQNTAFQPYATSSNGLVILSPSKLYEDRGTGLFYRLVSYLNYNQSFGKANITATLGHEAQESNYDDISATRQNLALNYQSISAGAQANQSIGGGKYPSSLDSYFARVGFAYNDKYALNLSARRDGSSTFGSGKKYGYFPAASLGWTITNENFAKDIKYVDYLKLRVGAGAVGNQNAPGNNLYATNISLISSAPFGPAGIPHNVGNPLLAWESVRTYNAGIDAAFFKKRLELTVDVYKKQTTDMILRAQLPAYSGLSQDTYSDIQPPYVNAGKMTNTGIDIGITSYNINNKDFKWRTNLIFSHYKNILNALNGDNAALYAYQEYSNAVTITKSIAGQPVGQFYGFVTDGLFRSEAEINKATVNGTVQGLTKGQKGIWLGDIRYVDFNGDGKLDQSDQRFIGNPNPKFTYGLTNTFNYKQFDLSVFLQGSYGNKILNYTKRTLESIRNPYYNQLSEVLSKRYTAANPSNSTLPRYDEWTNNSLLVSDRFVEDGSYLRIQNVSLGYNIPSQWIKRIKLSAARLYFSGQNIYTLTKYTGYDPELGSYNNSVLQSNVDNGNYPNPRTFTLGANITF